MDTKVLTDNCPKCGQDRKQLKMWLDEPLAWSHYPNGEPFWGKSDNRMSAESCLSNCPACKKALGK